MELSDSEDTTGIKPGELGVRWARRRGESGVPGSRGRWSGVTTMMVTGGDKAVWVCKRVKWVMGKKKKEVPRVE